jgi:hypothetical protein
MFTDAVILAARSHQPFDEKAFQVRLNAFENSWPTRREVFIAIPAGSSIKIARELYDKYATEINQADGKTATSQ